MPISHWPPFRLSIARKASDHFWQIASTFGGTVVPGQLNPGLHGGGTVSVGQPGIVTTSGAGSPSMNTVFSEPAELPGLGGP